MSHPDFRNKVAEITLLFWLMKIVATTLGETFGDFLSMTMNLGYLSGIGITILFFLVVMWIQLNVDTYVPYRYWLVIIATTTLGTEISDYLDRTLHFGYILGSLTLFTGLILILFFWYRRFKTIRVYPIYEKNKEVYYWLAILLSNSLGTAFGDLLSDVAGFSYLQGALITATVIAVVVALHYWTAFNEVFLFWLAFIFTRPFGATFGDFLTKPVARGGLQFSTLLASLVSVTLLIGLIVLESRRHEGSIR